MIVMNFGIIRIRQWRLNMENKDIYKNFNLEIKSSDEDKRLITAIASYEAVDRDNDVVHLDGLNLKNFKKNKGPILWSHDAKQHPVGKAIQTKVDGKNLVMKIQFTSEDENPFGYTTYKLIKGGYINNLSIRFQPDYKEAKYNDKRQGYDFYKSELLETSIVNVPANSGARVINRSIDKAITDKIIDEKEADEIKNYMKELLVEDEVIATKAEQTTNDEIKELIQKIDTLEDRINKIEDSSLNAEKNLYEGLFDDNTDQKESQSVDPNEQLIAEALKQLN